MEAASIFNLEFIKNKLKAGRQYAKKGKKNGFFHIFGGNTLVKVISALSALLFPRIMGGNFGVFRYAETLLGYLLIVNGLGMSGVILRYCAAFDTPVEQKSYFSFAVRFGMIADVVMLAVFCGILYIPAYFGVKMVQFNAESILTMMLFLLFFDFLFNSMLNFLRTNRENKKYASSSVAFSAMYALIPLVLSFIFRFFGRSMEGAVIGRYIAYAITLILVFKTVRTLPPFKEKALRLSRAEKIGVVKYSVNSLVASAFSMIMPLNENNILSVMVTDALFSDFQVAQIVPASVQFIANSVIVFAYPYFAKNYLDGKWIFKNTRKIILGMSALMGAISLVGIVFAPQIVLIFGSRFKTPDAVRLMRVFFITYAVNSAFKIPAGNILAAVGEVRFNVANAIFSCTVHIAICYEMTANYGIRGAAYGLLIGYLISSVAGLIYLRYYCNKLEKKKSVTAELPDKLQKADEKESQ